MPPLTHDSKASKWPERRSLGRVLHDSAHLAGGTARKSAGVNLPDPGAAFGGGAAQPATACGTFQACRGTAPRRSGASHVPLQHTAPTSLSHAAAAVASADWRRPHPSGPALMTTCRSVPASRPITRCTLIKSSSAGTQADEKLHGAAQRHASPQQSGSTGGPGGGWCTHQSRQRWLGAARSLDVSAATCT